MQRFRKFTDGITFSVSRDMRLALDNLSDQRQVTVSKILREILNDYFGNKKKSTSDTRR